MHHDYPDIVGLAASHVLPRWWDENGVPRYWDHHPKLCPSIYATEVALVEIACQACERRFDVQMYTSSMSRVRASLMNKPFLSLAERVLDSSIHYGDPPRHDHDAFGGECISGNTMNCYDLRVKEFWLRDTGGEWKRVAEFERDLNDLAELTNG